jgi:hypothetical protein
MMKTKPFAVFIAFVVLFAFHLPLLAHHGNAAYDYDKKYTLSGTVTEWIWANPHSWLKFDAKDEKGEVKNWVIEAGAPVDMARQGWGRNSFKPGDEVTVTVILAKNGHSVGRFSGTVTLNGKPFPPGSDNNSGSTASPSKP